MVILVLRNPFQAIEAKTKFVKIQVNHFKIITCLFLVFYLVLYIERFA